MDDFCLKKGESWSTQVSLESSFPSPLPPAHGNTLIPGSLSYWLRWVGDGLSWWTTNGLPRIPIWDILKGGECSQARRNQFKMRGCEKKSALTKYFLKPKGEFSIFDGKVVVIFFKFLPKKWERGEGSRAYSAPPTPTGLLSLTAPPSELWDQGLHDRNPKNWYLLWTMHGDSPVEFQ